MSYLTYDKEFQNKVISKKESGMLSKNICAEFDISVYTLYKILHMNGKMPIPSQASAGCSSEEGVEHRDLSPNNNNLQERPTSTWKNYEPMRHIKIEHTCLQCSKVFYARNRGERTKFCSNGCKSLYRTIQNSVMNTCDNCGAKFRVKSSAANHFIHCKKCRNKNLSRVSSKMSRQIEKWLRNSFVVETEKSFDWLYDKTKPKGRFRLDYFLPEYNLAIEYDGEQHFKPCFTSRWESVDKVQLRDRLKDYLCRQNDIKLLRINYKDDLTEETLLMKIYAELQKNESVEVLDKKLAR